MDGVLMGLVTSHSEPAICNCVFGLQVLFGTFVLFYELLKKFLHSAQSG